MFASLLVSKKDLVSTLLNLFLIVIAVILSFEAKGLLELFHNS